MSNLTIGERLKEAREAKKITLEDVYLKTKIHTSILQALEEDRFQEYSTVYIKGFLKIYSQFLGLEVPSILKEFLDLYSSKKPDHIVEELSKKRIDLNWPKFNPDLMRKILIVLVVIVLIFSFASCLRRLKNKARSAVKQEEVMEAPVIPIQKKKKSEFAKLTVRAKDKCWLQVNLDGRLVYRGTFVKGMSDNWQAKEKIELSVGNAGAIELEINGEVLSSLGRKGQVIKNIVITRDGFSIGKSR